MNPIAKALNISSDMRRLKDFTGTVINEDGQIANESDYEYCRTQYKKLIDDSAEVMETLIQTAMAAENPKMYEALSKVMDSITKATEALTSLNIQRDMIQAREEVVTPLKPNIMFVGTTAELQRKIKAIMAEEPDAS
jgi:hypothetical protein